MTRYTYTRHKVYARKKPKHRLSSIAVKLASAGYAELQRRKEAKKQAKEKERQEDEARHERTIQWKAKLAGIEAEHQARRDRENAKKPQGGPEYTI